MSWLCVPPTAPRPPLSMVSKRTASMPLQCASVRADSDPRCYGKTNVVPLEGACNSSKRGLSVSFGSRSRSRSRISPFPPLVASLANLL